MSRPQRVIAGSIFAVWISVSLAAFWWFQFKDIGNFENALASFDGTELAKLQMQPLSGRQALVVHFIDPDCPCSRFSRPHIEELERELSDRVEFRSASRLKSSMAFSVPATPSVAIWSESGELAYFGPYSGGAICGSGDDFVTSVFKRLEAGTNPKWLNLDAVGCFCPVKTRSKVIST